MAYNFKHSMLQFGLLSLLHLHIGIAQANDDSANLWYFNPRVGVSYATGISLDYRAIDIKGWEASVGIGLAKVNEKSGATTSEYVTLLPAITFGRAF